jgi:hypothetical protein
MTLTCPKCNQVLGSVSSTARLILTVHCPFDGHEFGVAVDPPTQAELTPAKTEEGAAEAAKPTVASA